MKKALGIALLCVLVGCSEPHDPTGGGKLAITKHANGTTASRGYILLRLVVMVQIAPVPDVVWLTALTDLPSEDEEVRPLTVTVPAPE
jgi:hypothetical protein